MKHFKIDHHCIGPEYPPFIVAEMSGNHNHSLERALNLVQAAKNAGVHAIKLQTYTPDTITLDSKDKGFMISDERSLWKGRNLYDLYQEAHLPWEWHKPIFDLCKKLGLVVFSTPFDETAVDFLEDLHTPCYKIASPEIIDLPLIHKVSSLSKPVIISTGAATLSEIAEAVEVARNAGCKDLVLLKCTAAYPALPSDANLRSIPYLAETFGTLVGLSDHTLGIGVPIASIAFGCCFIEKHFTLNREEGGVDSAFSLTPDEFKVLVKESKVAWEALGSIRFGPLEVESTTHSHRPSLYFVEELSQGQVVHAQHIRSVRPSMGLPPKEIDKVIGLQLKTHVKKGTPVSWDVFKG